MLLCFAEAQSLLGEKCAVGLSVCVAGVSVSLFICVHRGVWVLEKLLSESSVYPFYRSIFPLSLYRR